MRILCPLRRSASLRHHSTLSPPSQTAAASSKLMPAGLCAIRALSRMQMNSAYAPNLNPLLPKTWSPTANSLTAAPTASTSPASSLPRIRCFARRMPEMERYGQAATSIGFTSRAVRPGDRCGVDLDEDLVLFGYRPLDVFEPQDVRRPVPIVDNCFYETPFLLSFGCERRAELGARSGSPNRHP